MRNLILVLGDQLDRQSAAFDGFDPQQDRVWMAEVYEESTHVWSHQARIVLFLSAMRHFRDELRSRGFTVEYTRLTAGSLAEALKKDVAKLKPKSLVLVEPGDYRVRESLVKAFPKIEIRTDRHFFSTVAEFAEHAEGRKQLRLEYFYRELRRRHRVLMDGNQPEGGEWNYDSDNRESFGKQGPGLLPRAEDFPPDALTREVIAEVQGAFAQHPGELGHFNWPVTPEDARRSLRDFIDQRLPQFGRYQDAMWTGEPFLHHSRLAAALNLKLLDPREVVAGAEEAYRHGHAPLAAVEGFIRQILGWREYVRGIYWHFMPAYAEGNALDAHADLPKFYWTGDTEAVCLRESIGQTLQHGYAHHIQRLMVTGLYALLLGVEPRQIHEWYLAVYVDAVEWVELPNVIGMSQFADGGLMASKPYAATGKYIQRMSNYCNGCRYDPAEATGDRACPFTTLYWDFLLRNESRLRQVPRMEMQLRNLVRLSDERRAAIRTQAARLTSP
ncbi:MAG: cryptochrome/photolyase family protein [Bryobacteraceae bacterium]|nr:cryptochrome/photolyase family protein [Bryobacteraceae bacterium]